MARFIDDRGRLFGKVNVVDLLVIIAILAVAVFVIVRFVDTPENVPVRLTLVLHSVDNRTVDQYEELGELMDFGGVSLGEIEQVEVLPTLIEVATPAGELKTFDSDIKSDVWLTVQTNGYLTDDGVNVGNMAARVGASVHVVGPGYEAWVGIMRVVWGAEATE